MIDETGSKIHYRAGEVICVEKAAPKSLFIVERGLVGLFKQEGERVVLSGVRKEKEFLGESIAFEVRKKGYNAIALEETTLVSIRFEDIKGVLDECPDWLGNILSLISDRLKQTTETLNEHRIVDDKVASFAITPEKLLQYSNDIKSF